MAVTLKSKDNTKNTSEEMINSQNGSVKMELGNGDDVYVINDITKGATYISDAKNTGSDRFEDEKYLGFVENDDFEGYETGDHTTNGYAKSIENPGNDTVIIKNCSPDDLVLFFDVSLIDKAMYNSKYENAEYFSPDDMADDFLIIAKRDKLDEVLTGIEYENFEGIKNLVFIYDYFGTKNDDWVDGEKRYGSGYIKNIITVDKDGVSRQLDVESYVAKVSAAVKAYMTENASDIHWTDCDGNDCTNPDKMWNVIEDSDDTHRNAVMQIFLNEPLTYKELGMLGTEKADTLNGTLNNDKIYGYGGNDTIHAKGGNDTIIGGKGNDNLYGDSGNNKFVFKKGDGIDNVYSGEGTDTLVFDISEKNNLSYEKSGNNLVIKYGQGDKVQLINYFTNKYNSVQNIAFAADIDSEEAVENASVSITMPKNTDGLYTGTDNDDLIVLTGKATNVQAGKGNDIIFQNSDKAHVFNEDGGDDKYIISSMKQQTFIYDYDGRDVILLPDKKDNLKFVLELHLDAETGEITNTKDYYNNNENTAGSDLEIYAASERATCLLRAKTLITSLSEIYWKVKTAAKK